MLTILKDIQDILLSNIGKAEWEFRRVSNRMKRKRQPTGYLEAKRASNEINNLIGAHHRKAEYKNEN